jgi:serine/threonine protein kinase
MSGGCLFNRLHAKQGANLDATKRTIIALGLAYSLEYFHAKKMIHRDIKSLNVLLDADDYPKLCDYGMSRTIATDGAMTGGAGTSQWMAPEVLNSDPYDEKSDVYSYGILRWEILTSDVPFRGL